MIPKNFEVPYRKIIQLKNGQNVNLYWQDIQQPEEPIPHSLRVNDTYRKTTKKLYDNYSNENKKILKRVAFRKKVQTYE